MARLSHAEVFASDEISIVHVMNRTVRRSFLLGVDPVTGRNRSLNTALSRKAFLEAASQLLV
jgi:hypothetical protein